MEFFLEYLGFVLDDYFKSVEACTNHTLALSAL